MDFGGDKMSILIWKMTRQSDPVASYRLASYRLASYRLASYRLASYRLASDAPFSDHDARHAKSARGARTDLLIENQDACCKVSR